MVGGGHLKLVIEAHATSENPILSVGVVSDTHIPDRAAILPPNLLDSLRACKVDLILHAGDICTSVVLDQLGAVAPVIAVRGNRDWAFRDRLPWMRMLLLADVPVGLIHGHGNLGDYLWDKVQYIFTGYRLERYARLARRYAPQAKVIVFGHTHRAVNVIIDEVLFFNPGSANLPPPEQECEPGFGILRFYSGQRVTGELTRLSTD